MILKCPQCGEEYEVSSNKGKIENFNMRCHKCGANINSDENEVVEVKRLSEGRETIVVKEKKSHSGCLWAFVVVLLLIGVIVVTKPEIGKYITHPFLSNKQSKEPKEIQPEGTFVASDDLFYKSLTFKGKNTVVIRDAVFGMDFASEYEKDEEFLRVKTDKTDLLFEIISEDTLRGEGFAKGLYIKQ